MKHSICLLLLSMMAFASCTSCSAKGHGDGGEEKPSPQIVGRYGADMYFESEILGHKVQYSILLPKNYETETDRSYPVVYLLHGFGDNNKSWTGQWLNIIPLISSLEVRGMDDMIYVFPYGMNTYWCNRYNGKYNFMDMFIEELIPHIDAAYRTIPDRNHRSITGYSMGGFGAMAMAERHPEAFLCSAPLSMSFRTDEQYTTEGPQSGWDNQWGSIFGGVGCSGNDRLTDYYKLHCPFYQFVPENRETLSAVKWFLTCGDDEEQLLIANDALHIQMRENGIPHEYRVRNGGHEGSYWQSALREVLPMFCSYMNGAASWPGNYTEPEFTRAPFEADGTLRSGKYAPGGAVVYYVYDNSDRAAVEDILSLLYASSGKDASFICLPCDLSERTFDEWTAYYSAKYDSSIRCAVAMGSNVSGVCGRGMSRLYLFDPVLPSSFALESGTEYYFGCGDNSAAFRDAGRLYADCKRAGATFEYRVVKGTDNSHSDLLRVAYELKSYFFKQ